MSGDIKNISQQLKDQFHLKALRKLSEYGLRGQHKIEALRVVSHFEHARELEKEDFKDNYKSRVTEATKKLQQEAGKKGLDYNHPLAFLDKFSKDKMGLQARKIVRHAHEYNLNLLEKQETQELETIADKAGKREDLYKVFGKSTDRREGQDRRKDGQDRRTENRRSITRSRSR